MTQLGIIVAGDPILKEKAKPVKKIDRKLKQLLNDMAATMYEAQGVGLAAPQVGVSLRIIVVDVGDGLIELINPEIVQAEGYEIAKEGCLSIPGLFGEVKRYSEVTVEGLNKSGQHIRISCTGMLARCLQHEIDHLEGILFINRVETIFKGNT